MTIHDVQQGETLLTIAQKYGFRSWEAIWNHERNQDLRGKRPDPMVLAPGDKVVIPEKKKRPFQCETDQSHTFRLRSPGCYFTVCLQDESAKPYAGCAYELTVGKETFKGTTSADGMVSHPVKESAREGELKLWRNPEDPNGVYTWKIQIGHLDPLKDVSDIRGVQSRLNNLGYHTGPVDGRMSDATRSALKDFQRRIGYDPPTGEIDERTLAELAARHGR